MQLVPLGSTGLLVSPLALGAGPIPELMTGGDQQQQTAVLKHAIDLGLNWVDTAATYGGGTSEESLGRALAAIGSPQRVQVATKVRLFPDDLDDIPSAIRRSVEQSLERLRLPKVTLLQLHNSITAARDQEPTSVTPQDVVQGGILATMDELRQSGKVEHLGLTGIGQPAALREVIQSKAFGTIQIPFSLANPTAGLELSRCDFAEANYGNVIADCRAAGMGVFAIRVYAGGALLGATPAQHTYTTKFFPLDLYQRDLQRRERMLPCLENVTIQEAAVRFVTGSEFIDSAIIGFSQPSHIDQAVAAQRAGKLPEDLVQRLLEV